MSPKEATDVDDESSSSEDLVINKEDDWQDLENDEEELVIVSLFDERTFSNATDMLRDCREKHDFDIWKIRDDLNLDFFGLIKLVNYVRFETKSGKKPAQLPSKSAFDNDKYLQPTLADDALLYSLEDVFGTETEHDDGNPEDEVEVLRNQLASLQSQFEAYREQASAALLNGLEGEDPDRDTKPANKVARQSNHIEGSTPQDQRIEDGYFESYSYNSIHEYMIKDSIRTDAYRDFIYEHKHIFADKVVLDVGCGTGILSMFCAKAGAKMVIAVDNSTIIEKARENVYLNGFQDRVKCLRGKIEEVTLPVSQVDVIVSEWMGYCLLFESMLDSVIYARDKYLAPGGLMVPSHATIRVAPLADSELKASHIDFWREIYGFDMTPMIEKAHEEALIRIVDNKELAAEGAVLVRLDLHTAKVSELDFDSTFSVQWKEDFQRLEGFVIWFDMFFATSPSGQEVPEHMTIEDAKRKGLVAFSTGPSSPSTHWQQGVCLIEDPLEKMTASDELTGEVLYRKKAGKQRSLDIEIKWATGKGSRRSQKWILD